MTLRPLVLALALAPAACNLLTSNATLDPTAIATGVYTLTASTQLDSCDPPRFVGSIAVPIYAGSNAIEISDESSSVSAPTIARYSLTAGSGYTAEVPPAGAAFAPCPSGGSFSLDFTLTAASASAFEVVDDESWTIVSACPDTTIDAATVPSASCQASRTLEYTLVEACAAPCELVEDDLVATCVCPQGSD